MFKDFALLDVWIVLEPRYQSWLMKHDMIQFHLQKTE